MIARTKIKAFVLIIVGLLTLLAMFPSNLVSASGSRYVTADGQKLIAGGQELKAYGATFYPSFTIGNNTLRGSAWSKPEFSSYIDQVIQDAKDMNLNTLRVTDFLDDASSPFDNTVLSNIDYLLGKAEQNDMYIILDLSTFRNYLKKKGRFPYNPNEWTTFLELTIPRYKYSRALLNYAIAGEVDAPNGSEALRPSSEQLLDFFSAISEKIYELDEGHHLISPGGFLHLNWDSGIPWQEIFALPKISVVAIHVYSEGDEDSAIPAVSALAKSLDKPFQVEEFGFKQSLGDAERAQALKRVIDKSNIADAGTIIFWNMGPEVLAGSYDINKETPEAYEAIRSKSPIRTCGSDLNGDKFVDIDDYAILVADFLKPNPSNQRADINKDQIVDIGDYSILVSEFLNVCK